MQQPRKTRYIFDLPFIVRNNEVRIKTNNHKLFWALKEFLKEHGGHYNYSTKAWSLTDLALQEWLDVQAGFGWIA